MKPFSVLAALWITLLPVGILPAFGSSNPHTVNPQNQFHFKPSAKRHPAAAKRAATPAVRGPEKMLAHSTKERAVMSAHPMLSSNPVKPHRFGSNLPTGKLGFVSAIQIAAGGSTEYPAIAGDFNGDGKKDVALMVGQSVGDATVFSFSVLIGNGDGTFKTAALTGIPGNDDEAQILVGDVNGDGKDDIIVGHSAGGVNDNSSFNVFISNGDGTFTAGNNYNITDNPLIGGTLADVNGDGKLDVVVVDQNAPGNVWTLLGNGDGTFQTAASVAMTGPAGSNTILADLNGDGLLDIADFDYDSSQLTVFLATSASAYAQPASYDTPNDVNEACSLTAGDLNGDGKPELVAANCKQNNLTVYVNNGSGAFATGVYYASALSSTDSSNSADVYPQAVTIADVNGDGKADLVVANNDGGDVTVLLGKGDGTLNVPTVGFATGGFPYVPPIVADVNGDGLVDILVPDEEYSLVYLPGYGDGTFRAALDYYSPIAEGNSGYGLGIATGDFNGDGQPDFVLGNCCNETLGITVFLSRPDGSLLPGVNYSNSDLEYVAVADFTGDGKLDIAATNEDTGTVQLFVGAGDGTFTVGSAFPTDSTSSSPTDLVVGDFNHDGNPDIAVINAEGRNVGVLINGGGGAFLSPVNYSLSAYTNTGIAAGDLNGDGNLDLAVTLNSGAAVAILNGNHDGTFQAETDLLTFNNPEGLTLADLNGDGKLDVAVVGGVRNILPGEAVSISLNTGGGIFADAVTYASTLQSQIWDDPEPTFIKAADVDGDGMTDLVYTNSEFGTVGVLFGKGDGTYFSPVEYAAGGYAFGLTLADVNQDGALDVVTAGDDFSGVTVLLNNNGSKTLPNYIVSAAETSATITAGSTATFTLMLTPNNFYNGTVTFSCGMLPKGTTCSFSPASLTPNGNEQMSTQLTITTTGSATASLHAPADLNRPPASLNLLASLSGLGMFGTVLVGSLKKSSLKNKRSRALGILLAVAVVGILLCSVGCGGASHGGSGGSGTPAGDYTIPVTAAGTAGTNHGSTANHAFNLTVTVQQ